jgi:hypothetical protein
MTSNEKDQKYLVGLIYTMAAVALLGVSQPLWAIFPAAVAVITLWSVLKS